ncbi:MAG: ABC transporter ATP-binding protein [Clostridiales bacterium]|nr:ABC transporter ATP-binding protein [Clostridiales bacterium]
MLRLARFLKGHIPQAIIAPLCKLIEAIAELAVPMIVANVIDIGIAGGDKAYVIKYCIIIAALAVGGFIISITGQFLASKVGMHFGTRLRTATFKRINSLPASAANRMGGASIVTRITGDVMNCQQAVNMFLRLVLRMPFVLVGALVMSMIIDPVLSLLFVAMAVVLGGIISCVLKISLPRIRRSQKNLDELSRRSTESLTGARVIRAFNKQSNTEASFSSAADVTAKTNMSVSRIAALLAPMTFAVVNLAIICVLWFGGIKVNNGALTQGQIVALINYLNQAFFVIVAIGNVFSVFTRSAACAARVNEILDCPLEQDGNLEDIPDCDNVVEFCNVSFAYDGDYDVRDISFAVGKNKTLGIIGGTGSGKSTIINLIERFYSPDVGTIKFCGENLQSYRADAVRKAIGYVPQRTAVLAGTIESNLKIANPALTKERALTALKIAQAEELLASHGLDGAVAQDGKNLSGGQKQRVNIARSLCRDNLLYLFDDATSALDYKTERNFIEAMNDVSGAKIFVSQRISAVSGCDEILVLDNGKIVGRGTHDALKSSCPLYAEFCASQVG